MEPPLRRVLLLGEGNFSFAAALCGARGTQVVATCYESQEEAAGRGGAARSIRRLRDSGAEVVFSVDCTKLQEHFLPGQREFHRIYFNFPHCGRKAGVAKNRQLLARFFHGCAEVLAQEGEVHVALCNGQGGTPADQPRREWHNSWQIVAVAAGAGFVLSDVHPFKAETIDGYKCTGYRQMPMPQKCATPLVKDLAWSVSRGTENSCIQMLVENVKTTLNSLHQGVSGFKPSISLQEAASFGAELNDFAAFERQLGEIRHFLCVGPDPEPPGSCVGVIRTAPGEFQSPELVVVSASLNLDLLAMLLCGISDWRMLWTWDRRFLGQFPEGELRLFKSFSLYPPSYVHDVSFWVPDGEEFDEVAFHTLARRVSGEMVVSIQLRDNFQQPGTGRRSLCYRLTFQSCDRALGCREAAEMQLQFREEIQQHLGVTLR
ncbi:hypothetical protein DUI87_31518 [Hirundo rustica rustica]|uniref:phenylalanine--tRNA ligase n=1 Tax=Hirundo rustica rustica TaxID=333673 RepID=A0A3M0IZQ3_HIRRU|nr:hypothetical protein DUI87_31518 [Hirundo rustica rustica]